MEYMHPVRRRARYARNLLAAGARPEMWRDGIVIPAYWWVGHSNFGDDLTRWLLPRYGMLPVHRRAAHARLTGVGSILDMVEDDYDGAVWGSGLIRDVRKPLPAARVFAVRGPLTRERIGAAADTALGDPGLLVARHVQRPRRRTRIGVVAHGHHRFHTAFLALADQPGARRIHVSRTAPRTVRQIAGCDVIITTSLHGLITADAFGIPAVWTLLEPALEGGDFKFRDYEAALTPGASRFAAYDPDRTLAQWEARAGAVEAGSVDALADGLEGALRRLRAESADLPRFPAGLRRAMRSGRG